MRTSRLDFSNLKTLPVSGVYYLIGEDRFIHQQVLGRLLDKFVPELRDFNFHKFQISREANLNSLFSLIYEIPCLAEHRLIYITGLEKLNLSLTDRLISLLNERPDETILVFSSFRGEKEPPAGELKNLEKCLHKTSCVVKCSLTSENAANYIKTYLKQHNLTIYSDTLHLFTQKTAHNLGLLKQELDKLVLHTKSGSIITNTDINNLISKSLIVKIFSLSDAISEKNTRTALNTIEELLQAEFDPFQLLGFLTSYFKQVLLVKTLSAESLTSAQIAKKIGRKEDFYLKKCIKTAHRFSTAQLKNAIRMLLRTDLVLKSTRDHNLIMDLLVYQLCKN